MSITQTRHNILVHVGRSWQGLTRQEIEDRTGLDGNTVRPRVCELVKSSLLVEDGRTRPTRSGKPARVLFATMSPKQIEGLKHV